MSDWTVKWTGWKESQESDQLVSQWVAYADDKALYASYPGGEGSYNMKVRYGKEEFDGAEFQYILQKNS